MNKKEKKPLSKAVGEWDNGFSDREKIDYTYNEIRNAFLADRRYNQMMRVNQLQLILRGSATKNSANADSDDVDIHCNFNCDMSTEEKQVKVEQASKLAKWFRIHIEIAIFDKVIWSKTHHW